MNCFFLPRANWTRLHLEAMSIRVAENHDQTMTEVSKVQDAIERLQKRSEDDALGMYDCCADEQR
jgi:hypothetical protein